MAHFYLEASGSAPTPTIRVGTKSSGVRVHIRGWDIGVRVVGSYHSTTKKDIFDIFITGGSNDPTDWFKVGAVYNGMTEGDLDLSLIKYISDKYKGADGIKKLLRVVAEMQKKQQEKPENPSESTNEASNTL
jgi:hypothetical protein